MEPYEVYERFTETVFQFYYTVGGFMIQVALIPLRLATWVLERFGFGNDN